LITAVGLLRFGRQKLVHVSGETDDGHLSALENGQREPGSAVLLAISREFGKSADWILTGEGKN
jgi:transcriptional regulator with XRE-family HTH domain